MIELNTNTLLLNKYFGVSMTKIRNEYANKDFQEIMEIEAKEGNKKAKEYKKILSDPNKIYEIFNLINVENKYIILQNMSEDDLDKLLPLLDNKQLGIGLNFFTDEKLLEMSKELPIEILVGMIFENFQLTDILSLMEDSAKDVFLKEPDVKRRYMQNYFESLNQGDLQSIMARTKHADYNEKSKEEIVKELNEMSNGDYQHFVTSMDKEDSAGLINGICKQNDDLLMLFSPDDLIAPMELLLKEDKIKMMEKLDPEFLIPMIQELPLDLTQIVLTQIDSKDFAEILTDDYMEILKSVVLFSSKG